MCKKEIKVKVVKVKSRKGQQIRVYNPITKEKKYYKYNKKLKPIRYLLRFIDETTENRNEIKQDNDIKCWNKEKEKQIAEEIAKGIWQDIKEDPKLLRALIINHTVKVMQKEYENEPKNFKQKRGRKWETQNKQ